MENRRDNGGGVEEYKEINNVTINKKEGKKGARAGVGGIRKGGRH